MKLYIFARRDKKLQAFDLPYYKREDVEHEVEGVSRGLKFVKPEERARAADLALYYLGSFDDVKGKFDLLEEPEKLIDFEDYVPSREELKNEQAA